MRVLGFFGLVVVLLALLGGCVASLTLDVDVARLEKTPAGELVETPLGEWHTTHTLKLYPLADEPPAPVEPAGTG